MKIIITPKNEKGKKAIIKGVTMNKKGLGYIAPIIMITISILLSAYLLIPQVKDVTDTKSAVQILQDTNATINQTFTLDNTPMVDDSLTITGLTVNTNYTIDYDTATVILLANYSAINNYTASYEYTSASYLDSASDRALFAVIVLAVIVGLIYGVFSIFNLA